MRPNPAWENKTRQLIESVNKEIDETDQQINELNKAQEEKRLEIKGLELALRRRSV